jgi:hypothetical protein
MNNKNNIEDISVLQKRIALLERALAQFIGGNKVTGAIDSVFKRVIIGQMDAYPELTIDEILDMYPSLNPEQREHIKELINNRSTKQWKED